jgi:hypothetical protein
MKRVRINFDDGNFRALIIRSAEANLSISEMVNTAARLSLVEDEEDLTDIKRRASEKPISYSAFLAELKKSSLI